MKSNSKATGGRGKGKGKAKAEEGNNNTTAAGEDGGVEDENEDFITGGADDLSWLIKRVTFRLHETYPSPNRREFSTFSHILSEVATNADNHAINLCLFHLLRFICRHQNTNLLEIQLKSGR
jgi:hypothetical protein